MICDGNGPDHCCYITDGGPFGYNGVCRYLEEDVAGRRWSCILRRTLGSWYEVHKDVGYQKHVQTMWDKRGGGSCGEWPVKDELCGACGKRG